MKLMTCPLNGPRSIQEFVQGPVVRAMPDASAGTDEEWADYVFLEDNLRGVVREWWCHVPSNYWFVAERDTASDTILRTYDAAALG